MGTGGVSPGVKRQRHEADNLLPRLRMSGALRPFPHVHKKNLQGIWFWIVGRLVDFEGSERSRRDLFLRHSRVTCLELLKKVKKILGWNAVC